MKANPRVPGRFANSLIARKNTKTPEKKISCMKMAADTRVNFHTRCSLRKAFFRCALWSVQYRLDIEQFNTVNTNSREDMAA